VPEDLRLASVLETVLYYASDQQDDMERFYENVLGLESLGLGRWSLAFRLGQGVVLLFDRERSSTQDEPPPHGASGSIHAAFLAAPGEYEAWKERLADRSVTLIDEIAWDSGVRSCYFNDPAATCSRSQSAISGPGRRRQVRRKQPPGRCPGVSRGARARAEVSCRASAKTRQP
jgi:catechol 2,3-dioxygenase-like lactoylglutathione lyase family enzyme